MKIFPKFIEWTVYGVIGVDYSFYKKGHWHGKAVYFKKKLDNSWVKVDKIPNLCSLMDSHNPVDEIDWKYY